MRGQVGAVPQMFLECCVVGSVQGTTEVGTQTGAVLALAGDPMEMFGGWPAILDGAQERGRIHSHSYTSIYGKEAHMWSLKTRGQLAA